jgi:hypothetical protein
MADGSLSHHHLEGFLMLVTSILAVWMLGVAAIAIAERRNIADVPDLWEGSRLLWVLVLGWPVTLALFVAGGPFIDNEEDA